MRQLRTLVAIACMIWFVGCGTTGHSTGKAFASTGGDEATGTFAPAGQPSAPPVRIEAGESCIVEVGQTYVIAGTLSGSLEINFRILVAGRCGSPPGTFDEQWIAYGKFTGMINGSAANGGFSYVATVSAGGNVEGRIVFGQGLAGSLQVRGDFSDGKLSYQGSVDPKPHNKPMQAAGASRRR